MKYTKCDCSEVLNTNPINLLWCMLSLMVGGMATFAFLQPFWLIETQSPHCLGVYSYCVKDITSLIQDRQICGIYGGRFRLSNLPSLEWRLTCMLFGGGSLLHLFCAVFGFSTLCIGKTSRRKMACLLGFIQAVAVIFSVVGLILFPMGFNSKFVLHYCGVDSQRFNAGKCEAGWGLLLASMGTALSIFCPILAQFFDVHVCDKPYFNTESLYKLELGQLTTVVDSGEERECQNYTEMYIVDQPHGAMAESGQYQRQPRASPFLFTTDTLSSSTDHSLPPFN